MARHNRPTLTFKASPIRVRVPATSANLGSAFDCGGLALSLYDELVAQITDEEGINVDIHGEGADDLPRNHRHLVAKSMLAAFDAMGGRPRGFALVCANHIPHGRGLGSSSAAIVGGIVLARALVVGGDQLLPDADALALATELEGHPDNVAATLLGGFTIAWTEGSGRAVTLPAHRDIVPVVCIPTSSLATKKARGLLPETVAHADATFNVSRSALLVAAITKFPGLLMEATDDKLHQQQRGEAMPRSLELVAKLREAGFPAAISGAGPTVIALVNKQTAPLVAPLVGAKFDVLELAVDQSGAAVVPLDA
jgi:homoserine kinase